MSSSSKSKEPHGGDRYKCGRNPDEIRLNFVELDSRHVRCKTCNQIVTNKVERMRTHQKKACSSSIDDQTNNSSISTSSTTSTSSNSDSTQSFSSQSSSVPSGSPQQSPLNNTSTTSPAVGSKRKGQTQTKIEPIRTTKEYREACAVQLSKFFYSARLPFLVCENEEFKAYQEMLRPGITTTPLVTRKSLAGKYLDQEYGQIQLASKVS